MIPETRFHDLRHTYATLALQQGVDIKTVSSNLGHATVAFTLDVYGHVSEQMQKDSADKMQGYLDTLHRGLKKAGNG
ncbi:MAG: tyrosine-type recombinase/integrase [Clostridia bacterium]|nr:tyrosine-type recombinase/integrase [Clostridia bacterium]MBR2603230.1 tyrosine-type recombinase/integrase [Clostridia bacterium]